MGWLGGPPVRGRNWTAPRSAGRPVPVVSALLTLLPALAGCAGTFGPSSPAPAQASASTQASASPQASSGQGEVGAGGDTPSASGAVLLQRGDVSVKPPPGFSCPAKSLR